MYKPVVPKYIPQVGAKINNIVSHSTATNKICITTTSDSTEFCSSKDPPTVGRPHIVSHSTATNKIFITTTSENTKFACKGNIYKKTIFVNFTILGTVRTAFQKTLTSHIILQQSTAGRVHKEDYIRKSSAGRVQQEEYLRNIT